MSFLIHTFCIDILLLRRFSCKVEVQNRKRERKRERERGINDTIAGVMIVPVRIRVYIYKFCSVWLKAETFVTWRVKGRAEREREEYIYMDRLVEQCTQTLKSVQNSMSTVTSVKTPRWPCIRILSLSFSIFKKMCQSNMKMIMIRYFNVR